MEPSRSATRSASWTRDMTFLLHLKILRGLTGQLSAAGFRGTHRITRGKRSILAGCGGRSRSCRQIDTGFGRYLGGLTTPPYTAPAAVSPRSAACLLYTSPSPRD